MRLTVGFSDLFDQLGTDEVRYSGAAKKLSGREVEIKGFLSHAHGPRPSVLLVDQPGICPDCAAVPPAVITLQGATPLLNEGGEQPVRVVGRLDYGFRIDAGVASFLRIEEAAVELLEKQA
jgi:hypothetical protein